MSRRFSRISAAVAAITLSTAALAGCGSDSSSASDERTTLTFGVYDPTVETLYKESGVLDDAPYDVKFAILTVPQQFPSLYSGATDFAFIGHTALLTEAANSSIDWAAEGAQLKEFASLDAAYDSPQPLHVTVVKADSGIDTDADLKGKKWAHSGGSSEEMFFASLKAAGLTVDDVDLTVFDDFNAAAAAYQRGDVDVFSNGYRAVSESLAAGESRIVSDQNSLDARIRMAFVATPKTLDAKGEAISDFLDRTGDYTAWLHEHPTEAEAIYADGLSFTPEQAKDFWETSQWNLEPVDESYGTSFQAVSDVFFDQKAIPKKVDVASLLAPEFNDVIAAKTLPSS